MVLLSLLSIRLLPTVIFLNFISIVRNKRYKSEVHEAHPAVATASGSSSVLIFNHELQAHDALLVRSDTDLCRRSHGPLRRRNVAELVRLREAARHEVRLKEARRRSSCGHVVAVVVGGENVSVFVRERSAARERDLGGTDVGCRDEREGVLVRADGERFWVLRAELCDGVVQVRGSHYDFQCQLVAREGDIVFVAWLVRCEVAGRCYPLLFKDDSQRCA